MNDTMEVTETVFEQYVEIQRAGPVNMTNKSGVERAANNRGFYELVAFIESGDYYDLLMNYDELKEKYE